MTEVEQPPQNGIDLSATEDEESSKARPADIEQDMREMERRKRVEAIMSSKLFREELERIVDCARDSGNAAGILQQLSDIVGVPSSRVGSVFKSSTCMLPINDIRGVESMGYAKGEKILRCKLAATFRLLDLYGWTQGLGAQITARLKVDQEYFLVNPYGLLYHEITASSLNKVDMQGNIVEQGTTNFGVNKSHFVLHSVVHAARPDIRCAIYIGCSPVVAISSLKTGLLPLTKDACVLGELTSYSYIGYLHDEEERNKLVRNLGPNSKVMLLSNHGALCCGETIEEAFFAACHIVQACETQLKLLPVGLDNLVLIPEESRKLIYDQSRRPPEDLEKKFAAATISDSNKSEEEKKEGGDSQQKLLGQAPKWRVGGAEFEALMRMLDNAGYRTGYIYRHPLIKSEPPKPKNDVELPPAVSSLGYLLEEEELFRQGIWKKGDLRKGGDRSRWLNSPNVYQKVEVLETGTPDPKKITKWVAEGSPTHSTPVRIDDPLQFVPVNTNPKEFKRVQQQIKDNRRADKISAGPQSHILEGVTWDEANRIKDATVSSAGDHVVLMGAASKGIIQRGFQHNAAVYKAPYAKNPFDNVTDDELNEYKRTVERKKKSIHGEYTDTDFSESEALSSLQTSGAQQQTKQTTTTTTTANVSQSEPEDISEHQVMRIQTEQAPVPCQPEVVLSDASLSFINGERSHIAANRKPPTGRDVQILLNRPEDLNIHKSLNLPYIHSSSKNQYQKGEEDEKEKEEKSYNINCQAYHFQFKDLNKNSHSQLTNTLENYLYFQDPKDKVLSTTYTNTLDKHLYRSQGNGNDSSINLDMNNTSINKYLCLRSINPFETHCSNPKVCNEIFKSLLKSESLQNQKVRESNQSEIYLSALYKNCNFTSKTVKIPYRTVSHFGFNSPIREALPKHKHIAINQEHERTYIPMRKSISYEEIFSSPRYINLCESCFELIVRLKPELKENKTKLYNLTDWSYEDSRLTLTPNCSIVDKENQNNITDLDKIYTDFANYLDPTIEIEDTMNHETDKCNVMTSNLNDNVMRVNSFDSDYKNTGNSSNSLSEFKKSENDNIMDYNTETNIIEFKSCFDNAADGLPKRSKQNMEIYNNSVLIKHSNNFPKKISREENPQRKFQFEELLASFRNFDKSRNTEIPMNNNIKSHAYEEFHHIKNVYEENPLFMHALSRNLRQKDLVELNSEFELNYCSFQSLNNQNLEIENKTKEISENLEYIKCSNNNMAENNINLSKLFRSKSTVNCHQNSCIIYSPLELTILHKIHTNKLNKSEKIFEKIENAIRNKIIPTDVDIQMKDKDTYMQRESKENSSDKDCNFSNSTIKKDSPQRSQSITKRKINSSTPKIKLIKTSVENDTCRKQFNNSSTKTNNQSTKPIKTFLRKSNKASNCRNFVLENIRNVSVQHQSPRLNRLKNNSESKTGRNCSSASCENNLSKVFKHTPNERISKKSPYDKTSEIFPFQTKVVQGSPRFWISMSENPLENFEKFSSHLKTADNNCNPLNGSLNMKALDTEVVSKVDEEINALGDEIHQIQPRLEKYKRKLDEFGNRVTNCVNGIKECVTMQENIIGVQKKLRDCINSHQNAESNICRLQTFTLSETED